MTVSGGCGCCTFWLLLLALIVAAIAWALRRLGRRPAPYGGEPTRF